MMASSLRSPIAAWRQRRWRRPSTLQWALGVSIAAHAGLLSLRLVDPERFERLFRDVPLEVILVNARSSEAPAQAQAVAQASLAGGGDAASGRATSPLPASTRFELGDASEDARRRVEVPSPQTPTQQLARLQRDLAALSPPDPAEAAGQPGARDSAEHRRQLFEQLAEIERRINEDNARPRKRYVSPATREQAYALYFDQLRRRIEDRGTRDFPSTQGRKLYGELTVNMTIDARGRLVDAEVAVPSDSPLLDRQALAIVRAAAPFGSFGSAMRRQADQIVVTSRFRFSHDETVEAIFGTK